MNKIKLLSPDVYNKIAAGEVIENPVGVVKELVENCVDAGARRIVIEVNGGGFDLISVSDNGCGIAPDDVEYAFVKHATSKVQSVDDIYFLQTLGFRGEALASIAAVSRVKLTSRSRDNDTAICVNIENGKILSKNFVSANVGTKIEVRDLFYNTPARKKFLKTPAREGTEISKFVSKFILTNPNLEVEYRLDGQTVYYNKGKGLEEAIYAVYGENCLENCIKIVGSWQLMNITGYVGAPHFTKANKLCQTLAVNGRYVSDTKISAAIMQAFKPYLMTRQYPFYVLFLEIPCDRVDVNVHPKKSEIRFVNHDRVASAFYNAVNDGLIKYVNERQQDPFDMQGNPYLEVEVDDSFIDPGMSNEQRASLDFGEIVDRLGIEPMMEHQAEDVLQIESATEQAISDLALQKKTYEFETKFDIAQIRRELGMPEVEFKGKRGKKREPEPPIEGIIKETDEDERLYMRTRILGVAFRTYIILEIEDKIIFVDQHAAHERILFDQFMEHRTNHFEQLLVPYVFHTNDQEAEFIENNLENIKQAGILVQAFGKNTFRIKGISSLLIDTNLRDFVTYLLASIDEFKIDNQLIVDKIAARACKAAVKAGYVPNKFEIIYILKHVLSGSVLTCPHGRPITTVFTKGDLEKLFKRKV